MEIKLLGEKVGDILEITEDINHIRDIDSLLDRVLLEARKFTNADAGSIYLVKNNYLSFDYVQNDTLMKADQSGNHFLYSKFKIKIDENSIAGYVAKTKLPLVINDVYKLGDEVPYIFNQSFDKQSNYRTKAILTIPLITSRDKIIGVMQIINPKNKSEIIEFNNTDKQLVTYFASQAAVAIERAIMTRETILRMIRMAEMRDPKETGAHVNRVGAYAIEIYNSWAIKKKHTIDEIKKKKDILRIAAMLHDVGKIGISDLILRKNGKLTEGEFNEMKMHTIYGMELFSEKSSESDEIAGEIALNHHEKWDGTGYPGILNTNSDIYSFGRGKKGEEIPIYARIVALADVYDALFSKRSYKDSWSEESVLEYIKSERNKQFDPEVVDAFFSIYKVITAIREKYA